MRLESFALSDTGQKRPGNEDRVLARDDLGLLVVADGMGGHEGGEVASEIAVVVIERAVRRRIAAAHDPGPDDPMIVAGAVMARAVQAASRCIHRRSLREPDLRGMGTTAVAALLFGEQAVVANVGDSRCYRIREDRILRLTEDHSVVEDFVRLGVLEPEEARKHPMRNVLSRAIGQDERPEVDVTFAPVRPGDRLVLCSDGLTNFVEDEEIRGIAAEGPLEDAARQLVALANARGGDDNITVALGEIRS